MFKYLSTISNLPLTFEDSVFNRLMTSQPLWMLPRTGKYNKDIAHSFEKILEAFLQTINAQVIYEEAKKKKDELLKELEEKGSLDLEKAALLKTQETFFITRGAKVGSFKFKAKVVLKNPLETIPDEPNALVMGVNIVVVDFERKDNNTPNQPLKISKNAMERDLNKSRSTASTRVMDETTKKLLADKKLNRKL